MLGAVAVTTLELTQQILQLPAQQRVPEICLLACKSPDKDSGTMLLLCVSMVPESLSGLLDAECVWSELCCGPFHEAAAAPSCDAVRLTVRLASFCPNNAGLVPTEAPWKKKVQVKVVQLIPNEV